MRPSCQPVIVSFTAHWLAFRLNLIRTSSLLSFKYRRLLLYWALFYCTLQILYFLPIENLWQLCIEQGFWHHFSNSICSFDATLGVYVSHFGNSHNLSNIFIILYLLWSSLLLLLGFAEGSDDA